MSSLVRIVPWEEKPTIYHIAPSMDILSIVLTLILRYLINRGIIERDTDFRIGLQDPTKIRIVVDDEEEDREYRYEMEVEARTYVEIADREGESFYKYTILRLSYTFIDFTPFKKTRTVEKTFTIIYPEHSPNSEIEECLAQPLREFLEYCLKLS